MSAKSFTYLYQLQHSGSHLRVECCLW